MNRRQFLGASASLAISGCSGDRPQREAPPKPRATPEPVKGTPRPPGPQDEIAALIVAAQPGDLLPELVKRLRSGTTVDTVIAGAVACTVDHCRHESASPTGIVSHALFGLGPALRLSRKLPPERAAIPVLQAVSFVASEVRRSPYGPTPYDLPPLPTPASAEVPLMAALEAGDIEQAELWLATALASAPWQDAAAVLLDASTRRYGHVGHATIMLTHAIAHIVAHGRGLVRALRAPLRYLATHWPDDDTMVRVTAARSGQGGPHAGRIATHLSEKREIATVARDLTSRALETFVRIDREPLVFSEVHLVTGSNAVDRAARWLARDPSNATLASDVLVRGGGWIDRALEGGTEFGELALWDPSGIEASKPDLPGAIKTGTREQIVSAARATSSIDPPLASMLVEAACAQGRTTIQHSIKLVDLAFRHTQAGGDVPTTLAAASLGIAGSAGVRDPLYDSIIEAMGVEPHPALTG